VQSPEKWIEEDSDGPKKIFERRFQKRFVVSWFEVGKEVEGVPFANLQSSGANR